MQLLKNTTKKEKLLLCMILLICAGFISLVGAYILHRDSRTITDDLYRYETGDRFDYQGPSKVFKTKRGFELKNGENEFLLNAAPLYYKDEERLFLPQVMAVFCPSENKFGKLDYFTEIYKENNRVFVQNQHAEIPLNNGFLYDGAGLYLFMEKTIVQWNNEAVRLEPFSYVVVQFNERLELYPSQDGKCVQEDTGICKVMAKTESGYSVNLSTGILYRADGNEQQLLSHPSNLKEFE